MNKNGGLMDLPVMLLMLFMTIAFMIAIIPGISTLIDFEKQSNNLNCNGYVYQGNTGHTLSYNSTIGSRSTVGCLALDLYVPYIVLGVLVAAVAMMFYGRGQGGGQDYGGGSNF